MTVDEAIKDVESKARGRTRFVGMEPYRDEILVAEIYRLRALLDGTRMDSPGANR